MGLCNDSPYDAAQRYQRDDGSGFAQIAGLVWNSGPFPPYSDLDLRWDLPSIDPLTVTSAVITLEFTSNASGPGANIAIGKIVKNSPAAATTHAERVAKETSAVSSYNIETADLTGHTEDITGVFPVGVGGAAAWTSLNLYIAANNFGTTTLTSAILTLEAAGIGYSLPAHIPHYSPKAIAPGSDPVFFDVDTGIGVYMFTGNPEGSLTAAQGSLCMSTTGLYFKTTGAGNTGWTVKS